MNFNDIKVALAQEAARREMAPAPTAKDIQDSELAQQALGHPGWDLLQRHLVNQCVSVETLLRGLKDRLVSHKMLPHEAGWLIAEARECEGRLAALHETLEYLPGLVKKVQHANQ